MKELAQQYADAMVAYYVALYCEQQAEDKGCSEMHPFRRDRRVAFDKMLALADTLAEAAMDKARELDF
jgi:dsDNA-binding SOS-regulon protein